MLLLNLWNSNQGDMKRESFVSTIFIVFLQIEGNLLKKYQCTFLKRVPSIFRINIEIVLTKDYRFMSPWLLFRKFIFPSVLDQQATWFNNGLGFDWQKNLIDNWLLHHCTIAAPLPNANESWSRGDTMQAYACIGILFLRNLMTWHKNRTWHNRYKFAS